MSQQLEKTDPQIFGFIKQEYSRQQNGIELIASENYTSTSVMEAQGSILTNKYAEGYPQKRYYGGCQFIDDIESLAIERAKKLFGAEYANVQPHSGSQANMAAYFTLLKPGDTILGMDLSQGGHLTHGSPVNFSGKLFKPTYYGVDSESECINYDAVADIAQQTRPQLIIAGASSYPRTIDFKKFREIANSIDAFLLVDMAHIAGLVAAGLHPSPLPHAHLVTSTTHKTLRGPRGGIILTNEKELAKKVNSNIFPGIQGGPLEHVIAAKAVSFQEALQPPFTSYQELVLQNAQTLAASLNSEGLEIVTGGTDNHLILVKTDSTGLTGKEAESVLESVGITCNKNVIPNDKRSPFITSGIRLGTPAVTTRGFKQDEMKQIARWIALTLKNSQSKSNLEQIKNDVHDLCCRYPLGSSI